MSGFTKVKLETIAEVIDSLHQTPSYSEIGLPMVRVTDIKRGYLDLSNTLKVSPDVFAKFSKNHTPKKGDILFSRVGSYGNTCIVNNETKFCLGQNTAFIIPKENPLFLYYYLNSPDGQFEIESSVAGSTQPTVSLKSIKNFEVPSPSPEEQKAIASVLSSFDDKIDLLHRQNTTLERMAETLFRQWFVEEAQESWEEKSLKDVCQINNGYAFQSETYRELGQKIIRTMNFNNHWIELNSLVYISEELAKSFEKYYLKRNDFLLVMVGASLGNFAIVTDDVLPSLQNQNMWCFRADECNFQHYLNFALRNIINDSLNGASGSAREFFQKGVFYEIKVSTPPEDLILKFHDVSESYFSKIELNRKQIKTLEKLRDNLLPKLMNGDVRLAI